MPQSRVALFLSVDVIVTMLTLGLVSLRVGWRWNKRKLASSDYMICAAMAASLAHLVLDIIITAAYGYARHQSDLPPNLRNSTKTAIVFWLIQVFTKFPLMFSKLSLCLVYHNLLRYLDLPIVRVSRIINWGLMVVLAGFFTAATFVDIFTCTPIQKSWLPEMPGHCLDMQKFNYIISSVNISTSLLLICIPLPTLYLAQEKCIEVRQLIGLVLLGLIDTGISAVRLYMIYNVGDVRADFTWLIIPTHLVIVLEFNVTIIAASLVVMRPCFHAVLVMLFPCLQQTTRLIRGESQFRSRTGYIMSEGQKSRDGQNEMDEFGITKTVDIELASSIASAEDLTENRVMKHHIMRHWTDRPEWHEQEKGEYA